MREDQLAALERQQDQAAQAQANKKDKEKKQTPLSAMQKRLKQAKSVAESFASMSAAQLASVAKYLAPSLIAVAPVAVAGALYATANEIEDGQQQHQLEQKVNRPELEDILELDFSDVEQNDIDALEVLPELAVNLSELEDELESANDALPAAEAAVEQAEDLSGEIDALRADIQSVRDSIPAPQIIPAQVPTDLSSIESRLDGLDDDLIAVDRAKADAVLTSEAITETRDALQESIDVLEDANEIFAESLVTLETATGNLETATENLATKDDALEAAQEAAEALQIQTATSLAGADAELATELIAAQEAVVTAQTAADTALVDAAGAQMDADTALADALAAQTFADTAATNAALAQTSADENAVALETTATNIEALQSAAFTDIIAAYATGQSLQIQTTSAGCAAPFSPVTASNGSVGWSVTRTHSQIPGTLIETLCSVLTPATPALPDACVMTSPSIAWGIGGSSFTTTATNTLATIVLSVGPTTPINSPSFQYNVTQLSGAATSFTQVPPEDTDTWSAASIGNPITANVTFSPQNGSGSYTVAVSFITATLTADLVCTL